MAYVPEVNPNSSFSWSNFPFGVFSTEQDPSTRCATAIGDLVLDLSLVAKQGVFSDDAVNIAFAKASRFLLLFTTDNTKLNSFCSRI
jgi:hypothetical protein